MRYLLRLLLSSIFLCPVSLWSAEISPRLQEALTTASWNESIPVIVTFASQPDLQSLKKTRGQVRREEVVAQLHLRAEESQRDVRSFLRGRGTPFQELWIVNALALEATPGMIEALRAMPEIAAVEFDFLIEIPEATATLESAAQWNISAVGAPELWVQGVRGEGVTVAVVDTGVGLEHPDLLSSWRGGRNSWYDPYGDTQRPYDRQGHGTAVTGLIVGGSSGGARLGVAPGAKWMAAKAFNDEGTAQISRIILCLQWLLDPNRDGTGRDAPHIVNLSWGFDGVNKCQSGNSDSSSVPGSVRQALQALRAAGIAIVAAAGNKAQDEVPSSISPGNYPEVFAVGAVDRAMQIASFSSRGPSACNGALYPDLVAPGVSVRSLPERYWSGTSFAAPHVVGVMALLLSAYPDLEIETLEEVLRASARQSGESAPDNRIGFGIVSSAAAFDLLQHPPAPAQLLSPENGSSQSNSVTFRWKTPPDPLGLSVADLLLVSETADFSTLVTDGGEEKGDALLAGAGNLLIAWGVAVLVRRKRRWAAVLLVVTAVMTMSACGSAGSAEAESKGDSVQRVSGLEAGTYFWKVVSENSFGATSESEAWLFTID